MTDGDLSTHRVAPMLRLLGVVVLGTLLLFGWSYWNSTKRADELDRKADAFAVALDARAAIIDDLAAGQQELREQLLANNIDPTVPAPSETVREIIRETGATGAVGAQGIAGRDGITPACWFEQSQCRGETGPAGADGVDGQDGADSTVPGPQGPSGPAGSDGQNGAPGPACPAGYEPRVIENGPQAGWIACAPTGAP